MFIIGHLRGTSTRKVFPIRRKNSKTIKQSGNIVDDSNINFKNPQRGRIYNPSGISPTLNCMEGGGLEPKIVEGLNITEDGNSFCIDSNYHKGISPDSLGSGRRTHIKACLTPDRINKRQNGRRFKENGEPMFTLTGQDIHGVAVSYDRENGIGEKIDIAHTLNKSDWRGLNRNQKQNAVIENMRIRKQVVIDDRWQGKVRKYTEYTPSVTAHATGGWEDIKTIKNMRIRKLTPKECWRLQGFPDWAFERAAEVNSDTQLYRQAGNAVTVNVIEEIARRLDSEINTQTG